MLHRLAIALSLSLFALPSLASSDGDGCDFWLDDCPLPTYPFLWSGNDTRANLMLLQTEKKQLTLPFEQAGDPHAARLLSPFNMVRVPLPTHTDDELAKLKTALNAVDASLLPLLDGYAPGEPGEGRVISNQPANALRFIEVLTADQTLSPAERTELATERLRLLRGENAISPAAVPTAQAALWGQYLAAARAFYDGRFAEALTAFRTLSNASAPWVAETAHYMVLRTLLNQSMEGAHDEYGFVDIRKSDKALLTQALGAGQEYLSHYPQGEYVDSTKGLFRRLHWMAGDAASLLADYQRELDKVSDLPTLQTLVSELDQTLLSAHIGNEQLPPYDQTGDAPLTLLNALRGLRSDQWRGGAWNDEQFAAARQALQDKQQPELARYLDASVLLFAKKDYPGVLALIPTSDEAHDTLGFSLQILRGLALQQGNQLPVATSHWQKLLASRDNPQQRAFVEMMLAEAWLQAGSPEKVFAADSPINQVRLRSLLLKKTAYRDLLRQQRDKGANAVEKQVALHTLLVRDLELGDLKALLDDLGYIPADYRDPEPSRETPWLLPPDADIALGQFRWQGDGTESGYRCEGLEPVLKALLANPKNGHALNCFGEYLRLKAPHIDSSAEEAGVWPLPLFADPRAGEQQGATTLSRLRLYQTVMTLPGAKQEDKSYALYRAVMCYAPSGYNGCDGQAISKAQRKAWFDTLKQRYPGSPWAKKLRYYW